MHYTFQRIWKKLVRLAISNRKENEKEECFIIYFSFSTTVCGVVLFMSYFYLHLTNKGKEGYLGYCYFVTKTFCDLFTCFAHFTLKV